VTKDLVPDRSGRLDREALAAGVGGFIYGTVVVLSVIVAAAKAFPDKPGRLGLLVFVTTFIIWLAHVYAHSLAFSIGHDAHLSLARLRSTAVREASIRGAAVPPGAALLFAALGVLKAEVAVWLALALGMALLTAMGLVFARVERLGVLATLVAVVGNLAFGAVLILLKVLVAH
jgi:hypothetical protein